MSLFKAALTGFSAAGANVANKYLDEQIAKDRAQFLADLQRKTSGQIREDDFAFKTDPGRVQATRDIAAGDVAAKATATRDAEKAGWSDTEYQAARDAQTKKETDEEVRKRSLFAQAEAKFRPRTPGSDDPFSKLPPAVRASYQGLAKQAEQINAAITKARAEGAWDPDTNKSQEALQQELLDINRDARTLLTPYMPAVPGADKPDKPAVAPDLAEQIRNAARGGAQTNGAAPPATEGDPQREAMSLRQRGQADTRAAAQGINSSAQQAIRARDPEAAQAVMDSPSFKLLDQATKTAVRNVVYGK